MTAALERFDALPEAEATAALLECCASPAWAEAVATGRPYSDVAAVLAATDEHWVAIGDGERRVAIEAHPAIGDLAAARPGERREQAGVADAADDVQRGLREGNAAYRERFGFVFLTDASGRPAEEMLAELRARLGNDDATELDVAEGQQLRIVRRRLRKLLEAPSVTVSTHVLDTGRGRPGAATVRYATSADTSTWEDAGTRRTDAAGRVGAVEVPADGWVRLTFEATEPGPFFGAPIVTFAPGDRPHVHVPLLLAPFGYSTYLGA